VSEPTRLLEAGSAASRLLRAGLRDNPDAHSAHKAAVALGLGGAVATAAGASAATGASAALAAPAGAAATGAAATSVGVASLAVKWVLVGFVGGALTAGGATTLGERLSAPVEVPAVSQPAANAAVMPVQARALRGVPATPAPEAADPEPVPAPSKPAGEPSVFRSSAAHAPPPAPAAPRAEVPAAARRESEGRLGRDLSRIDETRRALRTGDPARALAQLDGYERARETSFFDREAMLLRIEALIQQGQREHASDLANDYFRRFPDDVHAPRLRALLHGAK